MNKKVVVCLAVTIVLLLCASAALAVINRLFKSQLDQSRFLLGQVESSVKQLQKDREQALRDNEKLQADALAYIALNNELRQDRETLQAKVNSSQQAIDIQKKELEKIQSELDVLRKRSAAKGSAEQALLKEKARMRDSIRKLEASISRERAIYHYNLAVAYTKAVLIAKAVSEYHKSLEYDPDNAEAHFNLGMLYKGQAHDPVKALEHFRRYLELKPDADDVWDVQDSIDKLILDNDRKAAVFQDIPETAGK